MAKIAFYKGKGNNIGNKIGTWLVQFWTGGQYSHVELICELGESNEMVSDDPMDWHWYSASGFDEGIVRIKKLDPKPQNWDIFDLDEFDELEAFAFMRSQIGKKYDWKGIFLSQFLPMGIHDKNKWFCSEICRRALCMGRMLECNGKSHKVHPNDLYNELTNLRLIKPWQR